MQINSNAQLRTIIAEVVLGEVRRWLHFNEYDADLDKLIAQIDAEERALESGQVIPSPKRREPREIRLLKFCHAQIFDFLDRWAPQTPALLAEAAVAEALLANNCDAPTVEALETAHLAAANAVTDWLAERNAITLGEFVAAANG